MLSVGSVLAEVLGELPAEEGEVIDLLLSRASKEHHSLRYCHAVRCGHLGALPCCAQLALLDGMATDGARRPLAETMY